MTFVEALGAQNGQTIVEALGGQKGERFEEIMEKKEITISDNPLAALALDFTIADSVDLLGKKASDLQTSMTVDGSGKVTGTSKYVTGYTGFSSKTEEQKGNYAAFHLAVGDLVIGTSVSIKCNGVALDPDGLFVMRFQDGVKSAKAVVTASKDGHESFTRVFDFSDVVRQSAS